MEYVLLGWPDEGPTLTLDYRQFSYAGKFVMSNTGKAVVRDGEAGESAGPPVTDDGDAADDVVAAAAFNEDRTDAGVCWIRYITVRDDRRGDGIGPRLAAFVADRAAARGYDRARIAVNNPFAYQALYRAGFHFTGEETGVAELVLDQPLGESDGAPGDRSRETYQSGLDRYRERDRSADGHDLSAEEREFLREKAGADPPEPIDPPA